MPNFRRNLAVKVETPGGDNPLLLTLVTNGPFYRGIAVSGVALVGRGGTSPYAYTIIAGSLPTGLSLNGITGAITGTPSSQGHFTFVARVQDAAANVYPHSFSIDVRSQLFQVGPLPIDGEIGLVYSYQFVVRDASGTTLTSGYSITAGNLPAGLSMNSAGLITGTPTAPHGISYATLTVTDGTDTLTLAFTITIYTFLTLDFEESRDPPTGWGGGAGTWLPSMIRGQEWRAHLVVTGGRPPYSFTESLVNPFPSGINLVANYRRLLSGKTMDAASSFAHLLAVGVTDSLGSFLLVQRAFFIVDSQQGRITPQLNGVDLSTDGPLSWNMKEGAGVTITASNDGQTVEYEISATGGGGSGIQTINGIGPTTAGDFLIVSDGSISIVENSNGELEFSVVGGGSQAGIQFEDQGSNLGTAGTVTELDFVGTGVTATRVSNKVTVTVPGATGTFVESINGIGPDSGGNVSIVPGTGISIEPTSNGDIEISTTGGATQAGIQWKDEGSNLGSSGTADTVDVVGNGATASRVSNTVTLTVPGPDTFNGIDFFGDGSDGDVVLDGTNTYASMFTKSGNNYTLLRDVHLNNLTFSGAGQLSHAGSCVYVYGTADFSASTSGTEVINASNLSPNGTSASSSSGGAGGFGSTQFTLTARVAGSGGGGGNVGNGSAGSNGGGSTNPAMGAGSSRQAGAGGAGVGGTTGGAGGAAQSGPNSSVNKYRRPSPPISLQRVTGLISLGGGSSGAGGGGAGGGGGVGGGGGGGGGSGGANCWLAFRTIVRGTVTISARGGNGGNGFGPASGTRGGGGGGSGGGGSALHFIYRSISGAGTFTLDASGGDGGTGGAGIGGGVNGSGGAGGDSGYVLAYNCATGDRTFTNSGGNAAGGAAGGVGVTTPGTGGAAVLTI